VDAFRFLHCADLHLDSPLRGLEADSDAPAERIRSATRDALINLVDVALSEQVKLVLIAGDLYDGDWQDWRTGQFLLRQLERLTREGIRVVAIRGNHDAESIITRRLRWPEGASLLRADRPETITFADLRVAVHGRSFPTREVLDNFVPSYPAALPDYLSIGLLHTAATGRAGHASYAPCTIEQLVGHGYGYWALGHIHAREILCRDPWIIFPGNIQGRHIRETGNQGATLVIVRGGVIAGVEHRPLDVVRWIQIDVDLTGAEDEDAAFARVRPVVGEALQAADGRLLAARVVLRGACPAHAALARSLGDTREMLRSEVLAAGGADAMWLEHVVLATRPALHITALRARTDMVGLLMREIEAASAADLVAPLQAWITGLLERAGVLRAALGETHAAVLTVDGALPADLVERAKSLLFARLAEG
jgi:DNA repair protein SbcD/Mre11